MKNTLRNRILIYLTLLLAYLYALLMYHTSPIEETHVCEEECCLNKTFVIKHNTKVMHIFFPFFE